MRAHVDAGDAVRESRDDVADNPPGGSRAGRAREEPGRHEGAGFVSAAAAVVFAIDQGETPREGARRARVRSPAPAGHPGKGARAGPEAVGARHLRRGWKGSWFFFFLEEGSRLNFWSMRGNKILSEHEQDSLRDDSEDGRTPVRPHFSSRSMRCLHKNNMIATTSREKTPNRCRGGAAAAVVNRFRRIEKFLDPLSAVRRGKKVFIFRFRFLFAGFCFLTLF